MIRSQCFYSSLLSYCFILRSIEDSTHKIHCTIPVNKSNSFSDYMSMLNIPDNTTIECYILFLIIPKPSEIYSQDSIN